MANTDDHNALARKFIEHAAEGALAMPMRFNGAPGKQGDYERLLRQLEAKIATFIEQHPRESGERSKHYAARLFDNSPQGRDRARVLSRAKDALVNLRQIASGKDALATLQAEADLHDYRERVGKLSTVISSAGDSELLLAKMFGALQQHQAAQKARSELSPLLSRATSAAAVLGYNAPATPKALSAPPAALAFAALITSATHARQS